jgi:ribonuclease-3
LIPLFLRKSYYSSEKPFILYLINLLGYCPRNIHVFKLAFRHKSVVQESIHGMKLSNERLEYLGDAVLSSIVADYLYKRFPYKEEGFLTEMRARIVSRSQLNKLALKLGIDRLVQSEANAHNTYKSINGDAFEALIGALYLDRGYEFTRRVIIKRFLEMHFDMDRLENEDSNFKSRIIVWSQKEKKEVEFRMTEEKGNAHDKQYRVDLLVDGEMVASGVDYSIKGAEQIAAGKALEIISPDEDHPNET